MAPPCISSHSVIMDAGTARKLQKDHADAFWKRCMGRTDYSWGPRAIGDHGAPVSLPKLKKAYEKGTRGISGAPY
ncbi:unnamed protein product [Staurois parvus]|uniref:Uncharacterized protein n=1 Tax=Staurois parvus TaxID=386267 RepID=A0ABN9FV33_9NEOB|nr:unnamed protein product [Staurois parvus]